MVSKTEWVRDVGRPTPHCLLHLQPSPCIIPITHHIARIPYSEGSLLKARKPMYTPWCRVWVAGQGGSGHDVSKLDPSSQALYI